MLEQTACPISALESQKCLELLKPQIGNYEIHWSILRRLYRKRRAFPSRAFSYLCRLGFFRAGKPYFINKMSDGTVFLGHHRDWYSMLCAVDPENDRPF